MKTVQKVANAVMKAFNADGITLRSSTSRPAARWCSTCISTCCRAGKAWRSGRIPRKMEKPEVLAANAEKIKAALG